MHYSHIEPFGSLVANKSALVLASSLLFLNFALLTLLVRICVLGSFSIRKDPFHEILFMRSDSQQISLTILVVL